MESKVYEGRSRIELINGDCMEALEGMEENQFDLAIVDPPYFSGPEKREYYGRKYSSHGVRRIDYKPLTNSWNVPSAKYFSSLHQVSNEQIVWGFNYYPHFQKSPGRIIWDKVNDTSSFSDCEIAYNSKINTVRIFRYMWSGMMQGCGDGTSKKMQGNKFLNEKKIHPTQKPVALYKWLLKNYAKPGDKILDTHGGSMSIAIACWDLGFDLTCYELDKDYYNASVKRFETHMKQGQLFDAPKVETGKQLEI